MFSGTDAARAAFMAAGHEEDTAGFEEADFVLLTDETGKRHLLFQTARGNFRRQGVADIADKHSAKASQAFGQVLEGGQQILDPFLPMHTTDPDHIVEPFLLRNRFVGGHLRCHVIHHDIRPKRVSDTLVPQTNA